MAVKLSQDEFIKQLSIEHPELELLSDYNGNKNYVTVRCKIHNHTFQTKPNWLHSGHGCQKCYDEKRGSTSRKTIEECVQQSKEIHGDKYDYSKAIYINNHTKMCVICPIHGEFWITPGKHIYRKQGCKQCAHERNGIKKRLKFTEVLKRAKEVHGDKYEYNESTYVSMEVDMKIICPIHGEYWQSPYLHTNGCGCPYCHESHLERDIAKLLTDNEVEFERQKKFEWLGKQSLDFYLSKYKIAIECQGKQHFEERQFFGGIEGLKVIQERDNKKSNLLKERNIPLYYIVDDNVNIDKLPKELYDIHNTIHIKDIDKLKELLV